MKEYLEKRIQYLFLTEAQQLRQLDKTARGTLERETCWMLIRDLTSRRHELEEALKYLQANPPVCKYNSLFTPLLPLPIDRPC